MTDRHGQTSSAPGRMQGAWVVALLVGGAILLGFGVRAVWRMMRPGPVSLSQAEPTIDEIMADLDTFDAVVHASQDYLSRGKSGTAMAILDRAVDIYPGEGSLHALRGQALVALGKKDKALEAFERACFVGPESAVNRDFAATLAAELGLDTQAVSHWARAQQLAPDNPKYPLYRAQVERRLGKVDEAKASLMLAGGLDPDIGVVWATLAAIALDENNPEMVLQHIARARALEPGNVSYRVIEAKGLRRLNRPGDALTLLGALDEASRTNLDVVEEMALCYGMLSKPKDAAALYDAALAKRPDDGPLALTTAEWFERAGDRATALDRAQRAAMLNARGAREMVERLQK